MVESVLTPEVKFNDLMEAARRCSVELLSNLHPPDTVMGSEEDGYHAEGHEVGIKDVPRKHNFIHTFVHELIHDLFPNLSELEVTNLADITHFSLTQEQVWRLEAMIPGFEQRRIAFRKKHITFGM